MKKIQVTKKGIYKAIQYNINDLLEIIDWLTEKTNAPPLQYHPNDNGYYLKVSDRKGYTFVLKKVNDGDFILRDELGFVDVITEEQLHAEYIIKEWL